MSETDESDREALICDHWRRLRTPWDVKTMGPRLRVPVMTPMPTVFQGELPSSAKMDVLEFCYETGTRDGRPAERIVCEGIVVEERFLPSPLEDTP